MCGSFGLCHFRQTSVWDSKLRILALETSGTHGSIALLEDDQLIVRADLDPSQRTAKSLIPTIATQLERAGWSASEMDLIAVTQGPGSFTGLRIGVTAAKTLAYSTHADVIGVNTLDVIARQVPQDFESVTCVIDAHRGQLFSKSFRREGEDSRTATSETETVDVELFLERLQPQQAVSGLVLKKIRTKLPVGTLVVDAEHWSPRAESVGLLAFHEYRTGRRDDPWKLVPNYFRQSAAEEKAESQSG